MSGKRVGKFRFKELKVVFPAEFDDSITGMHRN